MSQRFNKDDVDPGQTLDLTQLNATIPENLTPCWNRRNYSKQFSGDEATSLISLERDGL